MISLRKFDCYGQLIAASVCIASMAALLGLGSLIGLSIIGCWQLISAAFNTRSFINAGFKKRILYYWLLAIADLSLLLISYSSLEPASEILIEILTGISLIGAAAIAVYYWKIYFKLIDFLSLRSELDGLTKSKHRS